MLLKNILFTIRGKSKSKSWEIKRVLSLRGSVVGRVTSFVHPSHLSLHGGRIEFFPSDLISQKSQRQLETTCTDEREDVQLIVFSRVSTAVGMSVKWLQNETGMRIFLSFSQVW